MPSQRHVFPFEPSQYPESRVVQLEEVFDKIKESIFLYLIIGNKFLFDYFHGVNPTSSS
jgi:hypothetical protein